MLKAFGGILATTAGAVVVYFLVGDNGVLKNKPKEAMGGSIQSISAENLSPCCTWNV